MKSKKLISFLCAAAMTVSSFAGLAVTASANAGDVIAQQNFEAADVASWKGAREDAKIHGTVAANAQAAYDYFQTSDGGSMGEGLTTPTVAAPSVVGTKSFWIATQQGQNIDTTFKINPAVTTPTSKVVVAEFDMSLVSADYDGEGGGKPYTIGLGTGKGAEAFKLRVTDSKLSYYNGDNVVDTDCTLTTAGTWFHVVATMDFTSKTYYATMTPYNGDDLDNDNAIEIPVSEFVGSPASVESVCAEAVRLDGSHKGAIFSGFDNFVFKEGAAKEFGTVTINYVDEAGTALKTAKTVSAEVGQKYTVGDSEKANFMLDSDPDNYYEYTATGSTDSVASVTKEGPNTITLKFAKKAAITVTFRAVDVTGATVGTIAAVKSMPGATVNAFKSAYMKSGDTYYEAKELANYKLSATVGAADSNVDVQYKKAPNVVFFKEAEAYEGSTNYLSGENGYSGGTTAHAPTASNYTSGFLTDPVAADGTYEITIVTHDRKRGSVVGKVAPQGDGTFDTKYATPLTDGSHDSAGAFTSVAELSEGEAFFVGVNGEQMTSPKGVKDIDDLDYIVVKDTSIAAGVDPKATLAYDKASHKATATVSNWAEVGDDVSAQLIVACYTGTKLNDVKTYPMEIKYEKTGEVTIPAEVKLHEGDKLMLWDSVKGVKPIAAALTISAAQADEDTPPTPTKHTVTVATNADITSSIQVAGAAYTDGATKDQQVVITVTPNTDKEIKSVTWAPTSINATVAAVGDTDAKTYTFTMPDEDVTLTVTTGDKSVTPPTPTAVEYETFSAATVPTTWFQNNGNGSATIAGGRISMTTTNSGNNAYFGSHYSKVADAPDNLTVEFDYTSTTGTASGNNGSQIYFVSTDDDAPNWTQGGNKGKSYGVGIDLSKLGMTDTNTVYHVKMEIDNTVAKENQKVTVTVNGGTPIDVSFENTANPYTGDKVQTIYFRPGKTQVDTVDNFIMYSATDTKGDAPARYTITNNGGDGCTVTTIPTEGVTEGTPIKVTAPAEKIVKVTYGDAATEVTVTDGTFKMPAGNVTITTEDKPAPVLNDPVVAAGTSEEYALDGDVTYTTGTATGVYKTATVKLKNADGHATVAWSQNGNGTWGNWVGFTVAAPANYEITEITKSNDNTKVPDAMATVGQYDESDTKELVGYYVDASNDVADPYFFVKVKEIGGSNVQVYCYTIDVSKITCADQPKSTAASEKLDGTVNLTESLTVSNFNENVEITANAATGKLKWATAAGLGFGAEETGNFIAYGVKVDANMTADGYVETAIDDPGRVSGSDILALTTEGTVDGKKNADGSYIVYFLTAVNSADKNKGITITVDNDGDKEQYAPVTVTLDISALELETASGGTETSSGLAAGDAEAPAAEDTFFGDSTVKAQDLVKNYTVSVEGNTIKPAGILLNKEDYSGFGGGGKGYYLPIKLNVSTNTEIYVTNNIGGGKTYKDVTGSDTDKYNYEKVTEGTTTNVVFTLDDAALTQYTTGDQRLVIWVDEEDTDGNKKTPTKYTVDLSGIELMKEPVAGDDTGVTGNLDTSNTVGETLPPNTKAEDLGTIDLASADTSETGYVKYTVSGNAETLSDNKAYAAVKLTPPVKSATKVAIVSGENEQAVKTALDGVSATTELKDVAVLDVTNTKYYGIAFYKPATAGISGMFQLFSVAGEEEIGDRIILNFSDAGFKVTKPITLSAKTLDAANGTLQLTKGSGDNEYTLDIANIKAHMNGQSKLGYWYGVGVTYPETYDKDSKKVYFAKVAPSENWVSEGQGFLIKTGANYWDGFWDNLAQEINDKGATYSNDDFKYYLAFQDGPTFTITVKWTDAVVYPVGAAALTGGTLKFSKTKDGLTSDPQDNLTGVAAGTTVYVKAAATKGYKVPADGNYLSADGVSDFTQVADVSDNTTYTFTMPASDVSVSATFEEEAKPNFADTFNVTVDGSKTEIGTELTATVTANADGTPLPGTGMSYQWYRANDGSSDGTEIVGETENTYTLAADDVDKYVYVKVTYAGEDYAADNNVITSNKVGAVTMKLVYNYDYQADGATKQFVGKSRMSSNSGNDEGNDWDVVDDPDTSNEGNKVEQLMSAHNGGNGYVKAVLDFSDKVDNATAIKVEYDSYFNDTGDRTNLYLFDGNVRHDDTATSKDLNDTGVLFQQGMNKGNAFVAQNHSSQMEVKKWLHTVVSVDYKTKALTYTVTDTDGKVVASNADNKGSTAYLHDDVNYITGLEFYTYLNHKSVCIDNIKVYIIPGEAASVDIKYVDKANPETEVKNSETDNTAVKTLPYTVSAAKTANFEDESPKTKRYIYSAGDSTPTIAAVSDEDKTVTLAFDVIPYQNTTFSITLPSIASGEVKVPVKIKGTPTNKLTEDEAELDETVEVTIADQQLTGSESIKLLPGNYTYTIERTETYEGVEGEAVTVGGTIEKTLEANNQQPASLTLVYTTDGSSNGQVKEVEVVPESEGKYQGDSIDVKAEWKATQQVTSSGSKFKVYKYQSGLDDTISLDSAGKNTVYVTVTGDDTEYYYYEDFTGGVGAWTYSEADGTLSVGTDTSFGSSQVLKLLQTFNKNAVTATSVLESEVAAGETAVNVSFDVKLAKCNSAGRKPDASVAILGTGNKPIITISNEKDTDNLYLNGNTDESKATATINKSADATNGHYQSKDYGYHLLNVTAVLNMTTHKATVTIKDKNNSDTQLLSEEVDFQNTDVTGFLGFSTTANRSLGATGIANIVVK